MKLIIIIASSKMSYKSAFKHGVVYMRPYIEYCLYLQIIRCRWTEIRKKEMDSLFRRRHSYHFLCSYEWIWSGLTRRRNNSKFLVHSNVGFKTNRYLEASSIFRIGGNYITRNWTQYNMIHTKDLFEVTLVIVMYGDDHSFERLVRNKHFCTKKD